MFVPCREIGLVVRLLVLWAVIFLHSKKITQYPEKHFRFHLHWEIANVDPGLGYDLEIHSVRHSLVFLNEWNGAL